MWQIQPNTDFANPRIVRIYLNSKPFAISCKMGTQKEAGYGFQKGIFAKRREKFENNMGLI